MAAIVIRNACLLPIDDAMSVIDGGWIHIDGDTIVALGSGEPPLIEGADFINAGGDIVMPGMVNTHAHLAMTLFRGWARTSMTGSSAMSFRWSANASHRRWFELAQLLGALESVEAGVTTVADMYYYETQVGRVLDEAGMRGVVGQTIANFDPPDHKTIDEGLRSSRNSSTNSQDTTESFLDRATRTLFHRHRRNGAHRPLGRDHPNVPVQIHLAEMDSEMEWCRANHNLRPVAVVEKAGLLLPGLIAAHCLHLDQAEIERMAQAGVRVAHNARSNAKAGRGIAPVEAMRAAGIRGRHRDRWSDERQHPRPVRTVRPRLDVPEASRTQPQAHAGGPGDPHGDAGGRTGAGSRQSDRLAGARQESGHHSHRSLCAANAAGLRHLRGTGVLRDGGRCTRT